MAAATASPWGVPRAMHVKAQCRCPGGCPSHHMCVCRDAQLPDGSEMLMWRGIRSCTLRHTLAWRGVGGAACLLLASSAAAPCKHEVHGSIDTLTFSCCGLAHSYLGKPVPLRNTPWRMLLSAAACACTCRVCAHGCRCQLRTLLHQLAAEGSGYHPLVACRCGCLCMLGARPCVLCQCRKPLLYEDPAW